LRKESYTCLSDSPLFKDYQPGPSEIPSPELGAGPFPESPVPFGPFGESNPLPSGIPSPAFGAGPMPVAIALPANPTIPITKQVAITMVFFFIDISYTVLIDFFI
jgi:hypothetical protein